ncbi:Cellular nucleic acid-binding protein [Acipenser ruthenus]|uniref:Cellular nucleic acid-binding protein n=1 Tax=Acipenser ruthenus TaxID=7906 RepID=A0A444U5P1_ACIRT|nr:Cellular nucleic acid-binding protein [Acipenser ruthenus]
MDSRYYEKGLSNKPLTSHAVPRERGLVITNLNDTSLGLETETGSEAGRCGETGHVAINCSKTSEVNCYRCGESGHLARECTIEATA